MPQQQKRHHGAAECKELWQFVIQRGERLGQAALSKPETTNYDRACIFLANWMRHDVPLEVGLGNDQIGITYFVRFTAREN